MEGAELDVLEKVQVISYSLPLRTYNRRWYFQDSFEDTLGDMGLAGESMLPSMEASPLTANIPLYQAPFSLYPVFEIIHFVLTASKIRTEYGQEFAW